MAIKKMFNTQCAHLYGAPALDVGDGLMENFHVKQVCKDNSAASLCNSYKILASNYGNQ